MRTSLAFTLAVGLALAGCGRDADSMSPAQSDPTNADAASDAGTSASDTTGTGGSTPGGAMNGTMGSQATDMGGSGTGTGSSVGDAGTATTTRDNATVPPQDAPSGNPPY